MLTSAPLFPASSFPSQMVNGMSVLWGLSTENTIQSAYLATRPFTHCQSFHLGPLPHTICYTGRSPDTLNTLWMNKWLFCNFPLFKLSSFSSPFRFFTNGKVRYPSCPSQRYILPKQLIWPLGWVREKIIWKQTFLEISYT